MTDIDSILKSRDITLLTKVCLIKALIFPVIMYGCESWTINKAECWRIDSFELWCWRRLLRVPWTARSSNQSILKEISPEYSLEGLMLKLKLQSFGHLMWRTDSSEKTLMLGKIEGGRRREWQRMRWLDSITDSMDMSLGKLDVSLGVGDGQGGLAWCSSWGHKESDTTETLNWYAPLAMQKVTPLANTALPYLSWKSGACFQWLCLGIVCWMLWTQRWLRGVCFWPTAMSWSWKQNCGNSSCYCFAPSTSTLAFWKRDCQTFN